jgi:hypothetical protein
MWTASSHIRQDGALPTSGSTERQRAQASGTTISAEIERALQAVGSGRGAGDGGDEAIE